MVDLSINLHISQIAVVVNGFLVTKKKRNRVKELLPAVNDENFILDFDLKYRKYVSTVSSDMK